jgi:holo-[acyl-carrier protein] synthase
MIIGVGTDIIDSNRINKILNKHNEKFIKRVFGSNEIALLNKKKSIKNFLTKRFAGKEATWKALCSRRGDGLNFREIEILNNQQGQPYLFFSGRTKEYISLKEKSLGTNLKFDISLSDEPPYALAFVVISLAPIKKVLHKI